MDGKAGWQPRSKFLCAGFAAALTAFVLLRFVAFELFSGGAPAGLTVGVGSALLLGVILVPIGFPIASNRWLGPTGYRAIPCLAGALLLVLPLSFATIHLLPALNGSTDEIHAIKMGYPVFWTALLVPTALRLGKKASPPGQ